MAENDYDSPFLGGGGGGGGGLTPEPCPPGQVFVGPVGGCRPRCPQGQSWDEGAHTCRSRSGSISGDPTAPCPPGETREASSAICRCPPGQCRDVVSKECRGFNPNREKINETDDIERESGGGRGYCRQLDPGMQGQGGGGGAAGGGGGGVGAPARAATPGTDALLNMFGAQSKTIWDNLTPILEGKQTRFSPEIMASLDSKAKLASRGEARAGRDVILQDAIRRRLGRSPGATNRSIEGVERGATQSYTDAVINTRIKKAETDFTDRMMALEAAEKWLGQMQQYVATLDQTAAGREKAAAEIALGYARITAEKDMLRSRLQNDLAIAQGGWANAISLANLANLSGLFGRP